LVFPAVFLFFTTITITILKLAFFFGDYFSDLLAEMVGGAVVKIIKKLGVVVK